MSPKSNFNINQPINDGTRARANRVASVTASSTIGSIASSNPFTPITPSDIDDVDDEQADTPDDAGHLATPHHPHPPPSSVAMNRTLDIVDRVEGIDQPKVPHQLAASAQIDSDGILSSELPVVTHPPLIPSAYVETNDRNESPNSDPFEYDDDTSTRSPVASHELSTHSGQAEENNDADVAQHLPTSNQSYSNGLLPTDPTTNNPGEDEYPNGVQRSSTSEESESTGTHLTNAAPVVPEEYHDPNAVQQPSTLDQSDSTGSIHAYPTTVDPTPTLTPPAHFSLEQFQPLVHALAQLSYPFTFDGDIVMPDDQHLKLQIWQKEYKPSFGPRPAVSSNKWAKPAKVGPIDMSRE